MPGGPGDKAGRGGVAAALALDPGVVWDLKIFFSSASRVVSLADVEGGPSSLPCCWDKAFL